MQDEFFWSSWLYSIKQPDEVLYNPLPYSDVKETSEIILTVTTLQLQVSHAARHSGASL